MEPAVGALNAFSTNLISGLSVEQGGFDYWSDFLDWKTRVLLADYLIQAVSGTADALKSASLAAIEHRDQIFADSHATHQAWQRLNKQSARRPSPEQYIAEIPRGSIAERREQRITSSAEQCFFHLGQTLDRLAAAIIIVGGFGLKNVIKSDWTSIDKLRSAAGKDSQKPVSPLDYPLILESGTPGGDIQRRLIRETDAGPFGPVGWLQWMRDTRNAMTHRSPSAKMNVMVDGGKIIRIFYRHPKWSEIQSFAYSSQNDDGDRRRREHQLAMRKHYLMRESSDVLDGLCGSVTTMVENLVVSMEKCWVDRSQNPTLIAQHASQWPRHRPSILESVQFDGYGPMVEPKLDTMVVNPQSSRRWSAARVNGDRWSDWNG